MRNTTPTGGVARDEFSIRAEEFIRTLLEQRAARRKGGLYHLTQIQMAYNSGRIEGSELTEDQTRLLYETAAVDGFAHFDDVVETAGHFRMFDHMLDTLDQPVTAGRIKHFHRLLKAASTDASDPRFAVGDWKTVANTVGGITTTPPELVGRAIADLLATTPQPMAFEDICDFHWRFETIHPFQDGNGRVGRILLFEQCLRNGIMPFVVLDKDKAFYYRGLSQYGQEPGFLRETFRSFQDRYYAANAQFVPIVAP